MPRPGPVIANTLVKALHKSDGPAVDALRALYPEGTNLREKADLCIDAIEAFRARFGNGPVRVARSTGRINLLGMHVEHRGGHVNPMAIGEAFFVFQPRDDDEIHMCDANPNFAPRQFTIHEELPENVIDDWDAWTQQMLEQRPKDAIGDWSNYIKAPVLYFQHRHTNEDGRFEPALRGMNLAVLGNVPRAAGLGSSSCMVMGAAEAFLCVNKIRMSAADMVDACGLAEWYVGTRGGNGDHAAIKLGRKGHIVSIAQFPLRAEPHPFPETHAVVLANSMVEAKKQEGARDIFNQLVAAYVFGLLYIKRNFRELGKKLEHLRDVNPDKLGITDADIYRMLKTVPEYATRELLRLDLGQYTHDLERAFRTHAEPEDGYRVRAVTLYGIAECLRSSMGGKLLAKGDVATFGEMMTISHDGDRISRVDEHGHRIRTTLPLSDRLLDALIDSAESDDNVRLRGAQLWRQPGGYGASTEAQDILVDTALAVPGVAGAGLVGAGLGGSVVILVEKAQAQKVIDALAANYYLPRKLEVAARVMEPVAGCGVLDMTGGS